MSPYRLAERHRRWRFWAGATLACGIAGTIGALLAADLGPWAWAARAFHWA
jgi:CP family cyanate transporter-like MFS transporter